MHPQECSLNWGLLRDQRGADLRISQGDREFEVVSKHDGDFWFVSIYELERDRRRHLFEYKINHPPDETTACERGWEIFKKRHLNE